MGLIYLQRNRPEPECRPYQKTRKESSPNKAWLVLIGWIISWADQWEDYNSYFGEGVGISKSWATNHFLNFMVGLGIARTPVDISLSLMMCYNESTLRLKVWWKLTCPPSWAYLVLIGSCCVLGLCHACKVCALPPFLQFQCQLQAFDFEPWLCSY